MRRLACALLITGCAAAAEAPEPPATVDGDEPAAPAAPATPASRDAGVAPASPDAAPTATVDARAGDAIAAADRLAPAPDAVPAPVPALRCTAPGVLLCEDFEQGFVSTRWKRVTLFGGTANVDGERPRTGTRSLHLALPMGPNANNIQASGAHVRTVGAPFPLDRFYGRAYFYAKAALPTLHNWAIDAVGAAGAQNVRIALEGDSSSTGTAAPWLRYFGPSVPTGREGVGKAPNTKSLKWPVDRWVCLEWYFDAPMNVVRVWFDGSEELTITPQDTLAAPTGYPNPVWQMPPRFDYMDIGWLHYQLGNTGGNHVYYDDLVIADRRVGCM